MSAFNTAISAAKKLADELAVAEIPPQCQPLHANDNIAALNANIIAVAAEMYISFIPDSTYFFFQSDDINDGYFYDKVHPTLINLALWMSLAFWNNSDSCSSLHPQQTAPKTGPRPLPRPRPRPVQHSAPQQGEIPARGTYKRGQGISQSPSLSTRGITLTPYMVLPLFSTRFAVYSGGIWVSLIQPRLF